MDALSPSLEIRVATTPLDTIPGGPLCLTVGVRGRIDKVSNNAVLFAAPGTYRSMVAVTNFLPESMDTTSDSISHAAVTATPTSVASLVAYY